MARIICDLLCINVDVSWHIHHPRRIGVIQRPLMTSCRTIARSLPILNVALFETDMGWYRQRGVVDKHHIQFTLVISTRLSCFFHGNQRAFQHLLHQLVMSWTVFVWESCFVMFCPLPFSYRCGSWSRQGTRRRCRDSVTCCRGPGAPPRPPMHSSGLARCLPRFPGPMGFLWDSYGFVRASSWWCKGMTCQCIRRCECISSYLINILWLKYLREKWKSVLDSHEL